MINTLITINNFVDEQDCNTIIESIDNCDNKYILIDDKTRKSSLNDPNPKLVEIAKKYLNKIKEICEYDNLYMSEYMVTLSYPKMVMKTHYDTDGADHFFISAVLYANNNFTGGDIIFPNINMRHSPKKGDIAIFPAFGKEALHGVEMIKTGKRYAMPLWMTNQIDKAIFV